ncbi:GPI mannosyltransferase 2-like [Oopsacas minuta]|uniref:GPI mannosyltransferase 2 n=1 Tax=Oopsacas minuta TaxID=111878 RepID=A0AAV7IXJ1_9METZ|nr:GPI mannosyltransferase 2-like [Oopsacas minuta]
MADVSLHEERQSHSYLIEVLLGGLSSWDGEHYLLIAEQGYKHETNLAFFPLYPILIRAISYTLLSPLLFMGVQMHSVMLIAGVTLTLIAFPMATYQLHKLTDLIYPHRPLLSHITVLLFIINPANIFMSAVYTECLFALFSFACIRYLIAGKTSRACLYLALSCSTRSNGSILCIFIAMYYLEGIVTDFKLTTFIRKSLSCISQLLLGLSPIICYQVYTAHKLDYNYTGILPYSYIQQKHWGIGLMNYYEVKQLPNFMLALPVTTLSILAVWQEVMDVYRTEPGGWSQ